MPLLRARALKAVTPRFDATTVRNARSNAVAEDEADRQNREPEPKDWQHRYTLRIARPRITFMMLQCNIFVASAP